MVGAERPRVTTDALEEPHVRGHRISVRQIQALVEQRDQGPEAVADRYDLDVADVYHALAYYHDNPDEMRAVVDRRERAVAEFREDLNRPDGVAPESR